MEDFGLGVNRLVRILFERGLVGLQRDGGNDGQRYIDFRNREFL